MFHFGFSYIGMLYLVMLFIPNIIWAGRKPEGYEQFAKKESRILLLMERIGEAAVCCLVLIFSDFNIRETAWAAWLVLSFALMVIYELYWIRYFRSDRKMSDFYRSFCGVPVAGAVLPVCAFFLLGIYGSNIFLIAATLILGIGHIGIHRNHYKEISEKKEKKKLPIRMLKWFGTGIAAILFAVIVFVIGCRNFHYFSHYINIQNGVDEGIYVPLGGQEQYVLLRGKNLENPVIIYLHGGPAGPDTYCTYGFTDYLTDEYTVVSWDQRGCGRTYFKNEDADADNATASFEQAAADLDALVDYVCTRFEQDKVIIMGHSYGTILGIEYASEHSEKVSAYIGVAQVLSMEETDKYSYEDAYRKAEAAGADTTEMNAAYKAYQADQSIFNIMRLRTSIAAYHPVEIPDKTTWMAVTSPYFGMDDFRWFVKQLGSLEEFYTLNRQLFDATTQFDIEDIGTEYPFSVCFISGSCDWVCPVGPIQQFADGIHAQRKDFKIIDGCGHNVQFTLPEEFGVALKQMLKDVLI